MKLQTSITPRLDGSVIAHCESTEYAFCANTDGDLECDVQDEKHAAFLLASGNFYPADACDYDAAILLTNAQQPAADDSPDEEPDDELQDLNALPIEAATPPSRKRAKKAE